MKKILTIFAAMALTFSISNAFAYDYGIESGDYIQLESYASYGGGEFTWRLMDHDEDNGSFGETNFTWTSFCAERYQTISSWSPTEVTGLSNVTTSGNTLSEETAWLYWNFTNNTLEGYGDSGNDQQELQYLIWNELGQGSFSMSGQMEDWLSAAEEAILGGWTNSGRVMIVQLGSSQDTLIAGNPVPEPASMVLLGVGLIGLAAVGRKKVI